MKGKIKIIVSMFLLTFLLASCKNEEIQPEEKPIYNTGAVEQTTTTQQLEQTTEDDESDNFDDIKELDYVFNIDFSGITPTKETPKPANNPYNNLYLKIQSFVTYDESSDTLYYSNFGNDNYLYSYKDNERTCLIEMPVNFANYYDGNIYFLSDSDKKIPHQWDNYLSWGGSLYKYNIADKSIELILEKNLTNLSIYDDYFYFTESISSESVIDGETRYSSENISYRLRIGETMPENMGNLLPYFYGEYQLKLTTIETGRQLILSAVELVSDKETVKIGEITYSITYSSFFCIADDKFWYINISKDNRSLNSIDLTNGEIKTYKVSGTALGVFREDINTQMPDLKMTDVTSYAVVDGVLYVFSRDNWNLFRYDEEKELFAALSYGDIDFTGLFTDGNYIYGIRGIVGADIPTVIRFIPLGNGSYEEVVINR